MKLSSLLMVTLLSGSLALAQVCPPGTSPTCLVPSAAGVSTPYVISAGTVPTTLPAGCSFGTVSSMPGFPIATGPGCSNVSSDTACLLNELRAERAAIHVAGLELRGQMLITRIDALMSEETTFRLRLANNPAWPDAQIVATQIGNDATVLNRDITAYNRELSMISPGQRPFIASELNTFDTVYWQPALASLANYNTSFAQSMTAYQPAYACNPWLQGWITTYQASLGTLAQSPQAFASVRWWNAPQVLGSTEVYPTTSLPAAGGNTFVLPSGAVIFIPASGTMYAPGTMSTMSTTPLGYGYNYYPNTVPPTMGTVPTGTMMNNNAPSNLTTAPPTTNEPTGTDIAPTY